MVGEAVEKGGGRRQSVGEHRGEDLWSSSSASTGPCDLGDILRLSQGPAQQCCVSACKIDPLRGVIERLARRRPRCRVTMPPGWKLCQRTYRTAPPPRRCSRSATSTSLNSRQSFRRAASAEIDLRNVRSSHAHSSRATKGDSLDADRGLPGAKMVGVSKRATSPRRSRQDRGREEPAFSRLRPARKTPGLSMPHITLMVLDCTPSLRHD